MFVTAADFNLIPYSIPNLQLEANTFPLYVDKKEKEVLKHLLGVPLYDDFIDGLDALPDDWSAAAAYLTGELVVYGVDVFEALIDNTNSAPVNNGAVWDLIQEGNKWLELERGAIFVYEDSCCRSNHSTEWLGVKDMLVPRIFYSWLRDTFDSYSGIGVVQGNAENSKVTEPKQRLVDAWKDYASKARVMLDFVYTEAYHDPAIYNTCACCYPDADYINTFGL